MNVGVISIDFEVGFPIDGGVYGRGFEGRADVDCNSKVVHISLETYSAGPNGEFDVPAVYDETNPICRIADAVEGIYEDDIEEKLTKLSVEIGESQFLSDRDEHSTHRVIRGHAA